MCSLKSRESNKMASKGKLETETEREREREIERKREKRKRKGLEGGRKEERRLAKELLKATG